MLNSSNLLFIHSPAINQIYGGQPTSLLYALSVLSERVSRGEIEAVYEENIIVLNEQVQTTQQFEEHYLQNFEELLRSKKPRIVGFSNSILSQQFAIQLAQLAKKVDPSTITIFGGAHETALRPQYVNQHFKMGADLIVCGDAEYLLADTVEIILNSRASSTDKVMAALKASAKRISKLPGKASLLIAKNKQCESVLITSNKPLNLNVVPMMPRHLAKTERDNYHFSIFSERGRPLKTAQVMTYRGCLFAINPNNACKFCFIDRYVKRDVERVTKELEVLKAQGYEAVFFDDGTFTSRSIQRKRELVEISTSLKRLGFKQWGFQTRVDFVDEEVISTVKAGGCKYIAFGFESTDEKFLGLVGKKAGLESVREAFDLCRKYSIEVGVYTIFGAPDKNHQIYESQESIDSTISFLKHYVENGTIREILPNLLAYLPGTRLSTDYFLKKKRLPYFGTKHSGYPWNRFELGFAQHPHGIEEKRYELDGRKCSLPEYVVEKASKELGDAFLGQNYYMDEDILSKYRADKIEGIDFNYAMLAKPLQVAQKAASNVDKFLGNGELDHCLIDKLSMRARKIAAQLVKIKNPKQVILGRNTSEALKVASLLIGLKPGDHILSTNVDYEPTLNVFKADRDYSNSKLSTDGYTYGDYSSKKASSLESISERGTGISVKTINIFANGEVCSDQELEQRIIKALLPSTKVLFLSHVLRTDGRTLAIKDIARKARRVNPDLFVVVDGAQALANVPEVDFCDLAADVYLAAAHKTFESNVLGLAYISERLLSRSKKLLRSRVPFLQGMFDRSLYQGEYSSVMSSAEILAFIEVITWMKQKGFLKGNSFVGLHQHRKQIKDFFLEKLSDLRCPTTKKPIHTKLLSSPGNLDSTFILSFRIPGFDNRFLVQRLWEEHKVFCSYLANARCIRVSFGMKNTKEDVIKFFQALENCLRGEALLTETDVEEPYQEPSLLSVLDSEIK